MGQLLNIYNYKLVGHNISVLDNKVTVTLKLILGEADNIFEFLYVFDKRYDTFMFGNEVI
jgi:hypothetical protein